MYLEESTGSDNTKLMHLEDSTGSENTKRRDLIPPRQILTTMEWQYSLAAAHGTLCKGNPLDTMPREGCLPHHSCKLFLTTSPLHSEQSPYMICLSNSHTLYYDSP